MPAAWVAAAGAVAGAMNSGSNSSGGTQTATKDPWSAAVPWLTSNLQTGQNLQGFYQQNPFNPLQTGAYQGLLANNDYINQMVPGLLGQFSQSQGFDRNNQSARPQAFQFPTMAPRAPMAGLLGPSMAQARSSVPTVAPSPAAPATVTGLFGPVPAPAPVPGLTAPAPLPTTWPQYISTMGFDPSQGGG